MTRIKARVFWGLIFAIVFIYMYELTYALGHRPLFPGGEEMVEIRYAFAAHMFQKLISLSFPCYAITLNLLPADPYLDILVYVPLLAGVEWFIYGYLFGWWHETRKPEQPQRRIPRMQRYIAWFAIVLGCLEFPRLVFANANTLNRALEMSVLWLSSFPVLLGICLLRVWQGRRVQSQMKVIDWIQISLLGVGTIFLSILLYFVFRI